MNDSSDNEQDNYRNETAMNDQPLQKNNQTTYEPAGWLTGKLAGWTAGSLVNGLDS